jgi:hypothetical protein
MNRFGIWAYASCVLIMDSAIAHYFFRPTWYFPTPTDLCITIVGKPSSIWCVTPLSVSLCIIGVLVVHVLLFWLLYTAYRKLGDSTPVT